MENKTMMTDFYELTMAQTYFDKGEQNKNASMFSFGIGVVKKLVPHIGFWARLRFRLWMFVAGRKPSLRFYFWSKVFR